jgi:hypothetical protein
MQIKAKLEKVLGRQYHLITRATGWKPWRTQDIVRHYSVHPRPCLLRLDFLGAILGRRLGVSSSHHHFFLLLNKG